MLITIFFLNFPAFVFYSGFRPIVWRFYFLYNLWWWYLLHKMERSHTQIVLNLLLQVQPLWYRLQGLRGGCGPVYQRLFSETPILWRPHRESAKKSKGGILTKFMLTLSTRRFTIFLWLHSCETMKLIYFSQCYVLLRPLYNLYNLFRGTH